MGIAQDNGTNGKGGGSDRDEEKNLIGFEEAGAPNRMVDGAVVQGLLACHFLEARGG